MIELLVFIGMIVAISFCVLPFAVFGIKGRLEEIIYQNEVQSFHLKQILTEIKRARIIHDLTEQGIK